MPKSMANTYEPDRTTLRILSALANGASRSDAAARSDVSNSTMRRKLAKIRDEWDVETNVQVVVMAVRRGLV